MCVHAYLCLFVCVYTLACACFFPLAADALSNLSVDTEKADRRIGPFSSMGLMEEQVVLVE